MEQELREQNFSYRLKAELRDRKLKNPAYSLRAFSRYLGVHHSGLSQVLAGKRRVTEKMIRKLGEKLSLDPGELAYYINKNREQTGSDKPRISEDQLSLDSFAVISDWYHYALLELTRVENFQSDEKWIAKSLGISVFEVKEAITRLETLKMITKENGVLKDISGDVDCTHHTFTSVAKKKYQKQVFSKALDAIDEVDISKRSHSGMTLAIDTKRINEAKALINEFKWKFSQLMETVPGSSNQEEEISPDSVYHLSIGLFPLSEPTKLTNTGELK